MTEIEHIRKCSQYLNILLRNNPAYEEWLLLEGNLKRKYPLTELYSALGREAAKARSFNDLLRIFRRFKQLHFLRIGARDFLPLCGPVRDDRAVERSGVRGPPGWTGGPFGSS